MHKYIKSNYEDKLQGSITHYDALHSAERTVKGFTRNAHGASTHIIVGRPGEIHQIVSIRDRAWHCALKKVNGKPTEWLNNGGQFPMANGRGTANPNHWFVGIDMSNLGYLTEKNGKYYSHLKTVVPHADVAFDKKGKPWERYTEEALYSYEALILALSTELDIKEGMHYRHEDSSPTRKVDPGPVFPFHYVIDRVYALLDEYALWDQTDGHERIGDDDENYC
jgi:N-acetylmuramoyl-L-alanine amidase